jgi:hypothetical protein
VAQDPPLHPKQFGNVADLSAFRASKAPVRGHPMNMSNSELAHHLTYDHGIMPDDEMAGPAMMEFMHHDLHRAGRDTHVPTVEHTHETGSSRPRRR